MAADVAAPQVNGLAEDSRPASPQSVNSSVKRKRDASDDDADGHASPADARSPDESKPALNGTAAAAVRDEETLIRDFLDVLKRCAAYPPFLSMTIPLFLLYHPSIVLSMHHPSSCKHNNKQTKELRVIDLDSTLVSTWIRPSSKDPFQNPSRLMSRKPSDRSRMIPRSLPPSRTR